MFLNNKVYDVLKWTAQIALPGLATLYYAIAAIWGLPNADMVVGTILAVDVFLGAVLGISNMQYQMQANNEVDAQLSFSLEPENDFPKGWLSGETYELLKWATLMFLPAAGTLYFALAKIWGFPYGPEIVGTIAAFTAFMGVALGVSTFNLKRS